MLLASFGCVLIARSLGVGELYAVAASGAFAVALATLTVRWARYRIAFSRRLVPTRTFPDEIVRFELVVRNVARLPSPPVLVEDELPAALGGPARFSVGTLLPDRTRTISLERRATARGRYRVGPLRIRLTDPFGLAHLTTTNRREDLLIVYPRVEALGRATPPSARSGTGPSRAMRLSHEGDEFYAIREYEDGDDLRKIHWHSVARTGQLMIRQEETRLHPRATLLLDSRKEAHRGTGPRSSLEWTISATASAARHLGRSGFSVRLATDAGTVRAYGTGRRAIEGTLEALAVIEPTRRGALAPAVGRVGRRPAAGGALVAVLPPPAPKDLAALARLAGVYAWCGAILVDVDSFASASPRARADADQRIAAAERALARAGWRVRTAEANDRMAEAWKDLIAGPVSLRNSAYSPS